MNAKRLLSLWGLKWNPFSPELPSEGLLVTAAVENFVWRVEQLVQEGGFALVCGESGTGKSVALRIIAERLAALRDVVVGVIGGAPKCSKTWLGLDLALSVATGTACLGQYPVPQPGPVLVYLAEDALPIVRQRVEGMARHRGLALERVELYVITAPTLRLDRDPHRRQLQQTAQRLRPRRLLLDPLVRLHAIDENNASEVAGLLAYLRELQRQLDLSVMLVHHTRKNAAGVAAGQSLRGSGDLHAFGDSNLYLRRVKDRLLLVSEHRAAPASPPVYLDLVATDVDTIHLEVVTEVHDPPQPSLPELVLSLLAGGAVLTRAKLRDTLAVKNERLGQTLESLERASRIRHTPGGWQRLD